MKRALIPLLAAALLLIPALVAAQQPDEKSSVSAIDPVLVRQGDFAILLAEALHLGVVEREEEAIRHLEDGDIAPEDGWIADYPVTPEILAQLALTIGDAADSGAIALSRDEALGALQALAADFGLSIPDELVPRYARRYLRDDAYDCRGSTISRYYDNYGPPVLSYCRPPYDYDALYDWRPYGSWWHGHYYPGYYLLHRFHLVIQVESKRPHHRRHLAKPHAKSKHRHKKTGPHGGIRHLSNRNKPGKERPRHRRDPAAARSGERRLRPQRDFSAKRELPGKQGGIEKGKLRALKNREHRRASRFANGRPRLAPGALPAQRNAPNPRHGRGSSPGREPFRSTRQLRTEPRESRAVAKSAQKQRKHSFTKSPVPKRQATTKLQAKKRLNSAKRQRDQFASQPRATRAERDVRQRHQGAGRATSAGKRDLRRHYKKGQKQPLKALRKNLQRGKAMKLERRKHNRQRQDRVGSWRGDAKRKALRAENSGRPALKAQRKAAGRLAGERTRQLQRAGKQRR